MWIFKNHALTIEQNFLIEFSYIFSTTSAKAKLIEYPRIGQVVKCVAMVVITVVQPPLTFYKPQEIFYLILRDVSKISTNVISHPYYSIALQAVIVGQNMFYCLHFFFLATHYTIVRFGPSHLLVIDLMDKCPVITSIHRCKFCLLCNSISLVLTTFRSGQIAPRYFPCTVYYILYLFFRKGIEVTDRRSY